MKKFPRWLYALIIVLGAIILKLLVPDGDVIKQGTQELTNILKTPEGIPQLCNCLASSQVDIENGDIIKIESYIT